MRKYCIIKDYGVDIFTEEFGTWKEAMSTALRNWERLSATDKKRAVSYSVGIIDEEEGEIPGVWKKTNTNHTSGLIGCSPEEIFVDGKEFAVVDTSLVELFAMDAFATVGSWHEDKIEEMTDASIAYEYISDCYGEFFLTSEEKTAIAEELADMCRE